jgi:hypothetical protein
MRLNSDDTPRPKQKERKKKLDYIGAPQKCGVMM